MDFVIYSMGRTAVQWLGNALNIHPNIILWGGPEPFEEITDAADWDGYFARAKTVDVTRWMWPGKEPRHYGNLHGLEPTRFIKGTLTGTYRCVQLTREPISRLASIRARVTRSDLARFPDTYEALFKQTAESLKSFGITYPDTSPAGRALVWACGHLIPYDSRFLRSKIPVFRYEDMFKPGTLQEITRLVTDETWTEASLAQVAQLPVIDASEKDPLNSQEEAFAQKVIDAFQMREVYKRLGYLR